LVVECWDGWAINTSLESHLRNICSRFIADESGATAIEYGLIAAGIAIVIITAVNGVGTQLTAKFTTIQNELTKP
jgi:pilus assembly protein Flp/PilA